MIKKDDNHNNSFIGGSWEALAKEIYTPEEIAERNLRVAMISEIVKARKEKAIRQRK